jgi:hypothetical protein
MAPVILDGDDYVGAGGVMDWGRLQDDLMREYEGQMR